MRQGFYKVQVQHLQSHLFPELVANLLPFMWSFKSGVKKVAFINKGFSRLSHQNLRHLKLKNNGDVSS